MSNQVDLNDLKKEKVTMQVEMIKWMAEKLFDLFKGETRQVFLDNLKNEPDLVVRTFSYDIDLLLMRYSKETSRRAEAVAENDDVSAFVSCARAIVAYMRHDLLKEELESIPSRDPRGEPIDLKNFRVDPNNMAKWQREGPLPGLHS